jgi:hypothetical protein
MPKLRVNKGSGKQANYVTNYTMSIANSTVKASGLLTTDELCVYTDGNGKIIIEKIKETETMKPKNFISTMLEQQKAWHKVTTYFESKLYPNEIIMESTVYTYFHNENDATYFAKQKQDEWNKKEQEAKYKSSCDLKISVKLIAIDPLTIVGTARNKENKEIITDAYLEKDKDKNWLLSNVKCFEHY